MSTVSSTTSSHRLISIERLSILYVNMIHFILRFCHSFSRMTVVIGSFTLFIFLTASYDNALTLEGESVGLLEDVVMFAIVGMFMFAPIMLSLLTSAYNQVLEHTEYYLSISDEERQNFNQRISDHMNLKSRFSKKLSGCFILTGFIFFVVFQLIIPISGISQSSSWSMEPSKYPLIYLAATLWGFTYSVLIIPTILWYTFQISFSLFGEISKLSKNDDLNINPIAPDGCGGLKILGNLSVRVTQVPSLGVIFLTSWIFVFGFDIAALVLSILFMPFLFGIFLWPLMGIHGAMVRSRELAIKDINLLFLKEHENLVNTINQDTSYLAYQHAHNITALYTMYNHVMNMPIWPFDRRTISRIGTVMIIPFASGLTVFLQGMFL